MLMLVGVQRHTRLVVCVLGQKIYINVLYEHIDSQGLHECSVQKKKETGFLHFLQ